MAEATVRFLDPVRWAEASRAAQDDAHSRFATADVVARYERLYAEALEQVR